jgi:hypothetical protein
MVELIQIRSELFPKLYSAFLQNDDPLSSEQDWQNVFDYGWHKEEVHSGYALINNDDVVGMMAMAFSTRQIDGRQHKFCNLHTWWVHENYRGHSIAMMRPLLRMKDHTITHFTPCDRVRALTKRLGFTDLDIQMKVLLPTSRRSAVLHGDGISLDFDASIDTTKLAEHDQRVLKDHTPYRVGNLLVEDEIGQCLVVYTVVERYRVRYCHIHYFSNRELFARRENLIRMSLFQKHGVRFVAVNRRLVEDVKFPRSFDFWAPAQAVYRPANGLAPHLIDSLYSDVVMLRLAIMPHVSHELKQIARRWIPGLDQIPG